MYLQRPFAMGALEARLVVNNPISRELLYRINCLLTNLAFLLGASERHSYCFGSDSSLSTNTTTNSNAIDRFSKITSCLDLPFQQQPCLLQELKQRNRIKNACRLYPIRKNNSFNLFGF